MQSARRRTSRLSAALLAGFAVGALGITQAHALTGSPAGAVSVHWVLGGPGGPSLARAELTLERPTREVSIRVPGTGFVRYRVHDLRATCPLGSRSVDLGRLDRVDVVAAS